jgi:hypothetical protein
VQIELGDASGGEVGDNASGARAHHQNAVGQEHRLVVDLPRPRHPDITLDERFLRLKRLCHEQIREESIKAFEQQNR